MVKQSYAPVSGRVVRRPFALEKHYETGLNEITWKLLFIPDDFNYLEQGFPDCWAVLDGFSWHAVWAHCLHVGRT